MHDHVLFFHDNNNLCSVTFIRALRYGDTAEVPEDDEPPLRLGWDSEMFEVLYNQKAKKDAAPCCRNDCFHAHPVAWASGFQDKLRTMDRRWVLD